MLVPTRNYSNPVYRYGFQGQEKDNEIKGIGNSVNYKFRMHSPRVGRFFAVGSLAGKYPWYTPYQFSGNKVIAFVELEGLEEIALPRIGPVALPRTIFTIPRSPTIPIPVPPIVFEPMANSIPVHPGTPTMPLNYESNIDWNNPPSSPDDLGE